jgi:tetratricopeptide (TPR) repeat protein
MFFSQELRQVAIVGLGGIGKTQVALQFAYWVKENKPEYSIFWVPALSSASFEQAYSEIARKFSIQMSAEDRDINEAVRRYLESEESGQWLFLLDNADDEKLLLGDSDTPGLDEYLPQSDTGLVLFTTRSNKVAQQVADEVVELDEMGPKEAIRLLQVSLNRDIGNSAVADDLMKELAYLPLAITQAAAYLKINRISITEYLRLLRGTEQDMVGLMTREFHDKTRYKGSHNAVATTWLVSFDQIRKYDIDAANLLSYMSRIEPKGMPLSILPKPESEERLVNAIGTLCGYALISRRGDTDVFDMHSLVHLSTRVWVARQDLAIQVTQDMIQHLTDIFPANKPENRMVWRQYLPHTLRALDEDNLADMEEKCHLYMAVGACLYFDGRFKEAVRCFEACSKWRENHLPEDNRDLLYAQHELTVAYISNDQVKEAIELLEKVVAIKEGIYAEDHRSRLASQHWLAVAYKDNGQVKEAIELLERIVAIEGKTMAENNPTRLDSQHELAIAYKKNGQIEEAVRLLEHVVEIEGTVFAEDNPSRLTSQHELAVAYFDSGRLKEATELLERIIKIKEGIYTEDDPKRLASQYELSRAYSADGRVKEALQLLEHFVNIRGRSIGEDNPKQIMWQLELALSYTENGKLGQAVELLERVVDIVDRAFPEDEPIRLASQYFLGKTYTDNGQVKKAIPLLEKIAKVEGRPSKDRPRLLDVQKTLAIAYQADDRTKEAIAMFEHVVQDEEILAEDDPVRLVSKFWLAKSYLAGGRAKEAIKLLAHIAEVERVLPKDDPERLATLQALAECYRANGQDQEAMEISKEFSI